MAGAGADAPVSPQRAPAAAAAPRSASGLSSLAALNERKRKEVSPVKGAEATVCLPKRLRHPLAEASTTAVPAVLAAGASAEWKLYTEQVTPANGPPASPDQPRPHLGGGILPGQFEGDAATAVDAESITEEELVEAITAILENICAINNGRIAVPSNLGGTRAPYRSATYPDGSSSIFFSLQKPAVEMRYYVARLVKYMHVSTSVFVVALIYLDRVHAADEILALTDLNVHRLITTALAVATKWCEDEVHRNSTVCRIGGVPSTSEMNLLEGQFLRRIKWDCWVSVENYELYRSNVFKRKRAVPVAACPSSCSESPAEGEERSDGSGLSSDDVPPSVLQPPHFEKQVGGHVPARGGGAHQMVPHVCESP